MKSLRLKSRKLRSRKLRSRKLRKGGNGPSSSSSSSPESKVSYEYLKKLIYQIHEVQNFIIDEEDENDKDELKEDMERYIKELLGIFRNDMIDLSTLDNVKRDWLFERIIEFVNFEETDKKIVEAYANANLRQKIAWMNNEFFDSEIKDKEVSIEMVERNEDDSGDYETEEDKAEGINYYNKQINNIKIIRNIISIHEDSLMVNAIRAVKRGEEPGSVSKNSNHIGLPDSAFENVISYLHGPNYKHRAKNPKKYSDVEENYKRFVSEHPPDNGSSEVDGGGRRRKTNKRRKTNRKSIRRK